MTKKEFFKYLDGNNLERLRIKITTDKNKVVDVVVQYETFLNENFIGVVRYDCAHGFFHRDVLSPKGTQIKKEVIAIDDLKVALQYAEQDLKDRWNFYKQRYLKKLQK